MSSLQAGLVMGLSKLRSRAALITIVLAFVGTIVLSLLERSFAAPGAADRVVGTTFRLILPLTLFALSGAAVGLRNLRDDAWALARFGHARALVVLGHTAALALVSALVAVALVVLGIAITRVGVASVAGAPSLAADLLTTSWIAALAGLAYASWFSLGATLGRLGGGRAFVLTADFFIGPLGALGFLFPKGAVYNLAGLTPPAPIDQPTASVLLAALTIVVTGLLALRSR